MSLPSSRFVSITPLLPDGVLFAPALSQGRPSNSHPVNVTRSVLVVAPVISPAVVLDLHLTAPAPRSGVVKTASPVLAAIDGPATFSNLPFPGFASVVHVALVYLPFFFEMHVEGVSFSNLPLPGFASVAHELVVYLP